jgi:CubicO group peptidase (beta-lactamase class C family)
MLFLAACGGSGGSTPPPSYDWTAVGAALDQFVTTDSTPPSGEVSGYSFILYNKTGILYQRAGGDQTVDSTQLLASASKMPASAAILTLVDQGKLDLDTPVAYYLQAAGNPISWPSDKAAITMRMLLDHTSGLPGLDDNQPNCLSSPTSTTLQQCAQQIANTKLANPPPGSTFDYGGADYQVAGYVATVISGDSSWQTFFDNAIVKPLALTSYNYGDPATITNPRIAADATSNTTDYATILRMLQGNGKLGVKVLSASSVQTLETNQIAGVDVAFTPFPDGTAADFNGYTLGLWISASDQYPGSKGPEFSDPGALGTTPWFDNGLGYGAVILIDQDTATGLQMWQKVRPLIIAQLTGA